MVLKKPINKTFIAGRGGIIKKSAIKFMTKLENKLNGFLEDYEKFLRLKTTEPNGSKKKNYKYY